MPAQRKLASAGCIPLQPSHPAVPRLAAPVQAAAPLHLTNPPCSAPLAAPAQGAGPPPNAAHCVEHAHAQLATCHAVHLVLWTQSRSDGLQEPQLSPRIRPCMHQRVLHTSAALSVVIVLRKDPFVVLGRCLSSVAIVLRKDPFVVLGGCFSSVAIVLHKDPFVNLGGCFF